MTDINTRCLEIFPHWLAGLAEDVQTISTALAGELSREVKSTLTGGINYLFKSLDLVPDGIDDIGYLDDAFVLRMASRRACNQGIDALSDDIRTKLGRMSLDVDVIRELLCDELFARFEKYTDALANGSARGRTVEEILDDPAVASEFAAEVSDFVKTYEDPGFTPDEKNIIKLKAFMEARLPR
ncbi:MAG: DUF1232 domain-containing protein [Deltaproteobacteria bacterium]|nr:DUF1232 domain-containing protein [Deltaproteobacteria bacterium]